MMQAPCGTLFLRVIQAYSTLAFLSTGYRNTGEPTAGEPVIVSTCRILTASRGKLKERRSFVMKDFHCAGGGVEMKVKCKPLQNVSFYVMCQTPTNKYLIIFLFKIEEGSNIFAFDYSDLCVSKHESRKYNVHPG